MVEPYKLQREQPDRSQRFQMREILNSPVHVGRICYAESMHKYDWQKFQAIIND